MTNPNRLVDQDCTWLAMSKRGYP